MKRVQIVLSFGLGCFYMVLAYLTFNPNVSPDYRDYYIERSTDISPTQMQRLQPVEIGVPYRHDDEVHLGFKSGWSGSEREYRWSSKRNATIIFMGTAKGGVQANVIHLNFHLQSSQLVGISINGRTVFRGLLSQSTESAEVKLKSGTLRMGLNSIDFELPDAQRPRNGDSRLLALALKELRFN